VEFYQVVNIEKYPKSFLNGKEKKVVVLAMRYWGLGLSFKPFQQKMLEIMKCGPR